MARSPGDIERRVARWVLALALSGASAAAAACPICLGAGQPTRAQELTSAQQVVLAVPTADEGRYRIVQTIKGERPANAVIEGGHPRRAPVPETSSAKSKLLLLARSDPFPTWVIVGKVDADRSDWLRKLAAGKPAAAMRDEDWRARVALVVPYLENLDPLVAELAYGELAAAPYAAMRTAKSQLDARAIRAWLADPKLVERQRLYTLLLGLVGNAQDAAALEQRLETARKSGDATNLASMLAADLELRGAARVTWIEERYLVDRARSAPEIVAALQALSVHGTADGVIPRERVIQSYRAFMRAHPQIAGYVAPDLAAWQYWDAVPQYLALMKSGVPQQLPSRLATLAYLRQSPSAEAREFATSTPALPGSRQ